MSNDAFNETVAARRRVAEHLLASPELLARFVEIGGLPRDLEVISEAGRTAEDANVGQSASAAVGVAGTREAGEAFAALQREYKAIMAVVRAAREDLEESGAADDVLASVDQILADETAVHIKTHKGEGDRPIRRALKRHSQEAVRAEIRKDAAALLDHAEITRALAARRVDAARLTKLRDDADALSARLSSRTADKAERQAATARENAAVKAQRKRWGSVHLLLSAIDDPRHVALLAEARDRR